MGTNPFGDVEVSSNTNPFGDVEVKSAPVKAEITPTDQEQTPQYPSFMDTRAGQALKNTGEYLTGEMPDNPFFSTDYLTENIPRSILKLGPDIIQGIARSTYKAAKKFTDPIASVMEGGDLEEATVNLVHAPRDVITEFGLEAAHAMQAPLGLLGKEKMNEAWNHPAAAIATLIPFFPELKVQMSAIPKKLWSNKKVAGAILEEHYGKLIDKIDKKSDLTVSQQTGDKFAAMFEGSTMAADAKLSGKIFKREQKSQKKAQDSISTEIKKNIKSRTPRQITTPYEQGKIIRDSIRDESAKVSKNIEKLKKDIPQDYEINTTKFENELRAIYKDKSMGKPERSAVKKVLKDLKKIGRTKDIGSLWGLRRTIDGYKAKVPGTPEAVQYGKIKRSLDDNINEFSKNISESGLSEYKGKIINPKSLVDEYVKNEKEISSVNKTTTPDLDKIVSDLKKEKGTSIGLNQVFGESKKSYTERITKEYQKVIKKDIPIKQTGNELAKIDNLKNRNKKIKQMLDDSGVAADPALALGKFNQYVVDQWVNRFKRGAIRNIRKTGDEFGGVRKKAEDIPRMFNNVSDAKSMVKTFGKEKAADLIHDFYSREVRRRTDKSGANSGIDFLEANKGAIKEFGLENKLLSEIRDTIPAQIQEFISKKRPTGEMKHAITANEVRKYIHANRKAFQKLYGKRSPVLKNGIKYLRLLEKQQRGKNATQAGGPTTAEKLSNRGKIGKNTPFFQKLLWELSDSISGVVIGSQVIGGSTGAITGVVAAKILKVAKQERARIIDKIVSDGIYDLELASELINLAGKGNKTVKTPIVDKKITTLAAAYLSSKEDNKDKKGKNHGK